MPGGSDFPCSCVLQSMDQGSPALLEEGFLENQVPSCCGHWRSGKGLHFRTRLGLSKESNSVTGPEKGGKFPGGCQLSSR